MNKYQKVVLFIILQTALLMAIFPPFYLGNQSRYIKPLGYHFISYKKGSHIQIKYNTLFAQYVVLLMIGSSAFIAAKYIKKSKYVRVLNAIRGKITKGRLDHYAFLTVLWLAVILGIIILLPDILDKLTKAS